VLTSKATIDCPSEPKATLFFVDSQAVRIVVSLPKPSLAREGNNVVESLARAIKMANQRGIAAGDAQPRIVAGPGRKQAAFAVRYNLSGKIECARIIAAYRAVALVEIERLDGLSGKGSVRLNGEQLHQRP
jgi:hypothetical protein